MTDPISFYLASASPRRRELLASLNYPFAVLLADTDESSLPGETPEQLVVRLAEQKASMGMKHARLKRPVLGADTIVVIDDEILGKPEGKFDSLRMLEKLSGRAHRVMTAVAVASDCGCRSVLVITEVMMRSISLQERLDYWMSGEPVDKAGSYAIQGIGGKFVTRIHGSYSAVVGLPLVETDELLKRYL